MKVKRKPIESLDELRPGVFYNIQDLINILRNLGLSYSIYTIRDYETWKCLNYRCGKRHSKKVDKCKACGGPVREPLIISPRTLGSGKGYGHRRYTAEELRQIVEQFKKRYF
jgi:hypothetical protein